MTDKDTKLKTAKNLVQYVADNPVPMNVEALKVDETGNLTTKAQISGWQFAFAYSGFLFAVLGEKEGHTGRLRIQSNLGKIPYSAENAQGRTNALAVVESARELFSGRIQVLPDQTILLFEDIQIPKALTPKLIIQETACAVLKYKPYLELLDIILKMAAPPLARR